MFISRHATLKKKTKQQKETKKTLPLISHYKSTLQLVLPLKFLLCRVAREPGQGTSLALGMEKPRRLQPLLVHGVVRMVPFLISGQRRTKRRPDVQLLVSSNATQTQEPLPALDLSLIRPANNVFTVVFIN